MVKIKHTIPPLPKESPRDRQGECFGLFRLEAIASSEQEARSFLKLMMEELRLMMRTVSRCDYGQVRQVRCLAENQGRKSGLTLEFAFEVDEKRRKYQRAELEWLLLQARRDARADFRELRISKGIRSFPPARRSREVRQ